MDIAINLFAFLNFIGYNPLAFAGRRVSNQNNPPRPRIIRRQALFIFYERFIQRFI